MMLMKQTNRNIRTIEILIISLKELCKMSIMQLSAENMAKTPSNCGR